MRILFSCLALLLLLCLSTTVAGSSLSSLRRSLARVSVSVDIDQDNASEASSLSTTSDEAEVDDATSPTFRVQVGAFRQPALASTAWDSVKARVPFFSSLTPYFVQSPGPVSVTRIQAGSFPTRAAAEDVCRTVRVANFPCLIVSASDVQPQSTVSRRPPPIPVVTKADRVQTSRGSEPSWVALGRRDIGRTELRDPTFVLDLWRQGELTVPKSVETPWCAAWVSAKLEMVGIHSSRSGLSQSYLQWGQPLDGPAIGAIAIFPGHVGMVVGKDASGKSLMILGGNQSDAVTIERWSSRATGYRWPTGKPLPKASEIGMQALPVVARQSTL